MLVLLEVEAVGVELSEFVAEFVSLGVGVAVADMVGVVLALLEALFVLDTE